MGSEDIGRHMAGEREREWEALGYILCALIAGVDREPGEKDPGSSDPRDCEG